MIVLLLVIALALVGAPLFVIVGGATGAAFVEFTHEIKSWTDLGGSLIDPFETLMGKDQFLAVPLFIASGAIMTEGGMARRLVELARAGLGWLPGGLGITSVFACMVFAAITGSSPVTLIAVGSIMFPAMVKSGYPENFSLGLVMTAGSLGCLVMPSLILMIYALAVSMSAGTVQSQDMFIASFLPAVGVAGILCAYSVIVGLKHGQRERFDGAKLARNAREGVWALGLPVLVVAGIYTGAFPPFKAGAVAFVYALIVTTVIHRELDLPRVIGALANAGRLMGMLILIIAFTFGINKLVPLIGVEEKLTAFLTDNDIGPIGFMLLVNIFLIVVGALMDSVSATLVFAPILAPIAVNTYGIDPIHFGVVFVVNMEIGYLAPPVATNLFVAAALFKKPFGQVSRAILPGLGLTTIALMIFIFVPTCSKGLVNLQRDDAFYESFPWDGKPQHARGAGKELQLGDESTKAIEEAKQQTQQLNQMSDEDYYGLGGDDPTGAPADGDAGVDAAGTDGEGELDPNAVPL